MLKFEFCIIFLCHDLLLFFFFQPFETQKPFSAHGLYKNRQQARGEAKRNRKTKKHEQDYKLW